LYAIALGVLVRRDAFGRSDLAPWIIIPAFPLGAALVTALSRSGLGLGAATSSRYASLVSLFWIGLLVIYLAMALTERQRLRRSTCLAVFAILALLLLTQLVYRERIEQHIERNHDKRIAEIALALGIHDPGLIRAITPMPSQFISQIETLKQMRHSPFAADPDCIQWLGRKIPVAASDGVEGGVESASYGSSAPPDYIELAGWAGHAGSRAQCIAIVDAAETCVGIGVSGFMHKVAGASDVEKARIGWRLLKPGLGDGPLQAAALFPEKGGWRRFGGCFRIIDAGKSTLRITKCD
jgi:hypothetical protein